jgi:RNA polymerase sigma-70 factor (ECF subfamily)
MTAEDGLIRRAQAGDREAFADIVRLYQGRIRAFLGRYSRNDDIVDDLSQDVFLTAYTALSTYEGRSPLSTWLFGIARHRAQTFLRDEQKRGRRYLSGLDRALAEWRIGLLEEDAGEERAGERRIAALVECVKQLPKKSSRMISMHYFERMRTAEIARVIGRKGGAVRMALMRIRSALRNCVERTVAETLG